MQSVDREDFGGAAIARLKSGVTLQEAGAEMSTIMSRLDSAHSEDMRGWTALVKPFLDTALGPVRPLMGLLLGAICFVLLIACVNAASLLLSTSCQNRERPKQISKFGQDGTNRIRPLVSAFVHTLPHFVTTCMTP